MFQITKILYTILLSIIFIGCTKENITKKIVISNWIGYAPILYAYEKGYLSSYNIEIIITNSLQTSTKIFQKNNYDGISLTQHEFDTLKNKQNQELIPIYLFDKSYGGDAILSNITQKELFEQKHKVINVYLEQNSVNDILYKELKNLKDWNNTTFNLNDETQDKILSLPYNTKKTIPEIIITYEPYLSQLLSKGFNIIESTKNKDLLILDFLTVKKNLFTMKEIKEIQNILDKSTQRIKNNPKEFYKTVKMYYNDMRYEDFLKSLDNIQFINKNNRNEIIKDIENKKILENIKYL